MVRAGFDGSYGTNPAENYERFFVPYIGAPLATALIRRAAVQPGARVLDVACGTGIVARLVSQVAGADGAVAGLDPNAAMLAIARGATSRGATIAWHEAPAEHMPLPPGSFDVVLCQMGLQFMADRAAALAEMRRVLNGSGRVFLSVPGPIAGAFAVLATALERHVSPQAAGFVRQVFALHDVTELERLLRDAGFADVSVEAEDHDLRLPPPREFLWQYIHGTPLAPVVSQAGAEAVQALEHEVLDAWAGLVRDGIFAHRLRLVVASGAKAAA